MSARLVRVVVMVLACSILSGCAGFGGHGAYRRPSRGGATALILKLVVVAVAEAIERKERQEREEERDRQRERERERDRERNRMQNLERERDREAREALRAQARRIARDYLRTALRTVDLSPCREVGLPPGSGHAQATFADGHISNVVVDAPKGLSDAAVKCVGERIGTVTIDSLVVTALAAGGYGIEPMPVGITWSVE